jgi:aldose 1-epimerase
MKPSVEKSAFGKLPDGTPVDLYTLANSNGLVVKIANYGTVITELHVPDRRGVLGDVVLGFDNLQQYLKGHPYFGCTVGRVANRIARGEFTLEGKTYKLAVNSGPSHLHGGLKGFDKAVWKAEPQSGAAVKFSYTSADGEEGYPGKAAVAVTMSLTDANELSLDYTATTDKPTPINLTNHSYFNLACAGTVLDHELMLAADYYTPSDATLVPTGEIKPVKGTPMDFTVARPIGSRLSELTNQPVGYDFNYVLRRASQGLTLGARVYEPTSGRVMEMETTEPGVQLYTANFLNGSLTGKRGVVYAQHTAFCLETQHFPDAVHQPKFPSIILYPGQTYRQATVYRFATR